MRKYRMGRAAGRWPTIRAALGSRLRAVGSGASVAKGNSATGVAHFFVFWGFTAAFLATVILTIDTDVVRKVSKLIVGHQDSFFHGTFFIVFTFVVDTMGFAFLVALIYMALRRGVSRPWRLGYARAGTPAGDYSRKRLVEGDWVFLGLLIFILVTAYLLTGLRILGQNMPWFTVFSPFARAVAEVLSGSGVTPAQAVTVHTVVWWVHAALALSFVAYIPYSKAMHMLADVVNVLATDRSATLTLPAPAASRPGYQEISDFTWKELLDLDACTKCGRCHEVCPARTAGAPLSPRDLILDLRQWVDTSAGGITLLDRERRPQCTGPLAKGDEVRIAGDVIDAATLWSCTTCMHCVEVCPVGIEHVPTIVQLRRALVDEGTMDPTLQQALQNLASQGNSFGKSARMRARWTRELGFEIPDARKQPVKYLWFVGDFASFDERLQEAPGSRQILRDARVDFGLLYDAGSATRARRAPLGEEVCSRCSPSNNIEALRGAQFDEIFTTDPHTLNALRNEYPRLGASYKVWHYTELLAELSENGEIAVPPSWATGSPTTTRATWPGTAACSSGRGGSCGRSAASWSRCRATGADTFRCGGRRPDLDGRQLPHGAAEREPDRRALQLDVSQFVVACPKDVTDVLRRGQDRRG